MLTKALLLVGAGFLLGACAYQNGEDLAGGLPAPSCDTSHVTYALTAAPLLQQSCAPCHTAGAAGGVSVSTYAGVRAIANNGQLLGTVNHEAGYSPMPKGAAKLSDCDISKLRQWVADGALNN